MVTRNTASIRPHLVPDVWPRLPKSPTVVRVSLRSVVRKKALNLWLRPPKHAWFVRVFFLNYYHRSPVRYSVCRQLLSSFRAKKCRMPSCDIARNSCVMCWENSRAFCFNKQQQKLNTNIFFPLLVCNYVYVCFLLSLLVSSAKDDDN